MVYPVKKMTQTYVITTLAILQLFVASFASAEAVSSDVYRGMSTLSISLIAAVAGAVILSVTLGIVLLMSRKMRSWKKRKVSVDAVEQSKNSNKQALTENALAQSTTEEREVAVGETAVAHTTGMAPFVSEIHASGSTLGMLQAAPQLDPVAAGHGVVHLVELIRHSKATAQKILEQADTVVLQAEIARDQGLVLNTSLLEAYDLAIHTKLLSSQVLAIKDDMTSHNPGALLIWHRAQLDECISMVAAARSKLIPAIDKWHAGIELYRTDLSAQAESQKIEAERVIKAEKEFDKATDFIEAVQSGFSLGEVKEYFKKSDAAHA